MDFKLNEEQQAIQSTFRAFANEQIMPVAREIDESKAFPREVFEAIGELGFFGMRYPEPWGIGAGIVSYVLAIEELARGNMSVAAAAAMQSLMGTHFVHRFADDELKKRVLDKALIGAEVCTICMTEPNSGSDLFSMSTKAVAEGDRYLISGQKTWITSAPVADWFTVFSRTAEKGLSIFLVERGASGLQVGRAIEKMGVRASVTSEVFFDNTPATALLGELNQGTTYLREILAEIRVMTAALAVGIGQAAYESAVTYAAERRQFGRPINRFQAVAAHLANMAVDLEAARRMTYWAAWRSDEGLPNAHEASMAKLFASEAALRICDSAARVLGSYGYAAEYPVERYLRDVRFTLIGGGTSEILRVNIARGLSL
ncbi:MAG: acyl-CoA dehydrogenase [Proteobacteria bacterium]|jgi:alkylation response protein AidB-like acyl-CoA dehydrogenase|nr:acyl-CoA dehydrogenase [Pseudomonadota bacterium]